MDSAARSDDDPMRIYQVFQNSFKANKEGSFPSSNPTTPASNTEMDANQFAAPGFNPAASGSAPGNPSEGNFNNPESPYFPFGANPRQNRVVGKVNLEAMFVTL